MENKTMLKCVNFLEKLGRYMENQGLVGDTQTSYTNRYGVVSEALVINPFLLNVDGIDRYVFGDCDDEVARTITFSDRAKVMSLYQNQITKMTAVGQTLEPATWGQTPVLEKKIGTWKDRRVYKSVEDIEGGLRSLNSAEWDFRNERGIPFGQELTNQERCDVIRYAAQKTDLYGTRVIEDDIVAAYLLVGDDGVDHITQLATDLIERDFTAINLSKLVLAGKDIETANEFVVKSGQDTGGNGENPVTGQT